MGRTSITRASAEVYSANTEENKMPLQGTTINLKARIFNKNLAEQDISNSLTTITKLFRRKTVNNMVYSTPSGVLYTKRSGAGFRRRHRASAYGERPAVDTGNLIRAVKDQKISKTQHDVFIDDNDAAYGRYLESIRLGRRIMTKDDGENFQQNEMKPEIDKLTKKLIGD